MSDASDPTAPKVRDPFASLNPKLGELNRSAFGPLAGPTHNLMAEPGTLTGLTQGAAPPTLAAPRAAPEELPTLAGREKGQLEPTPTPPPTAAPLRESPSSSTPAEPPLLTEGLPKIEPPPRSYGDPYAPAAKAPGEDLRISTLSPNANNTPEDYHSTPNYKVDMDALAKTQGTGPKKDAYAKNAQLIRDNFPHVVEPGASDSEAYAQLHDHMVNNLLWLHDTIGEHWGPEALKKASQWYDGANKIANDWAEQYGYTPQGTAGMLAALSPQKDWFQNVSFGRRILDIKRDWADRTATPEMLKFADQEIARIKAKDIDPQDKAEQIANIEAGKNILSAVPLRGVQDADRQAQFIRWADEAHGDPNYGVVTPDGRILDDQLVLTDKGLPRNRGWGSYGEIAKGIRALDEPTVPNISGLMGDRHKVRNFYNNIVSPMSDQGDVTIDTHAIAAALLRPLSQAHPEVTWGLGGGEGAANSGIEGTKGLYPLFADAYRTAARARGLLPRQMQSITWEGIRGTFTPAQKRNKAFVDAIKSAWDARGAYSDDEIRDHILNYARPDGRITQPLWERSRSEEDAD